LKRQQRYLFTIIQGEIPAKIGFKVGPGIGLTRGSDRVIMKFNLSLESFIGAVFAATPDRRWLF
jgi:hypothetical protein